jgi:hypothetical protein
MAITFRTALTAAALTLMLGTPLAAQDRKEPAGVPDPAGPTTNSPDGNARTALPEQDVSPDSTGERPGSAASRKADEIK